MIQTKPKLALCSYDQVCGVVIEAQSSGRGGTRAAWKFLHKKQVRWIRLRLSWLQDSGRIWSVMKRLLEQIFLNFPSS
jgi:hypothetical protein